MDLLLKIVLIILFILIFIQDYKDRLVYWLLYFFVGVASLCLQLSFFLWQIVATQVFLNCCFILVLIATIFLYSNFFKKQKFLNHSIGVGDIFLFFSTAFMFPTITFIVLFIFSLIFSLTVHMLLIKKKSMHITVPLAGYMSLFFSSVIFISLFLEKNWLFIL